MRSRLRLRGGIPWEQAAASKADKTGVAMVDGTRRRSFEGEETATIASPAKSLRAVIAAAVCLCGTAFASNVEGGKVLPLASGFEGATLVQHDLKAFDEVKLLQAPADLAVYGKGLAALQSAEWLIVEGKVTRLAYDLPEDRSSLEVLRNHEQALEAKGFSSVFRCAAEACDKTGEVDHPAYLASAIFTSNVLKFTLCSPVRYTLMKPICRREPATSAFSLASTAQRPRHISSLRKLSPWTPASSTFSKPANSKGQSAVPAKSTFMASCSTPTRTP
jgi:hypothetical protein